MINFPLESDVRTQVDLRLRNLGWKFDGAKKNVFSEQPKTVSEKRKLKGKRPDYVLYEKGKDQPLIIIETKKAGSNIHSALEQGREYAQALDAPIVFATDGVFYKSFHTETQKPLYLNGEEVDELIREVTAIQYLEAGTFALDTIPPEVRIGRDQLINIFEEANNKLRVEGLRAGIERFSEFANILFLKLFSEIDDQRPEQIVDRKYKWNFYKNKPSDEILDYINNTVLQKIGKIFKDEDIFVPLQIKDGNVLKSIIDKLDPLPLINIHSDIKGDAFEYFLKATTATGNDLGEYFTPRHIVKMMVKLVNPQITEKIYDPFCGTGGLLIESYRHIYNTMPQNDRNKDLLKKHTIYGNEITNTARITKMNMILAGDGHSNINQKNSLQFPDDIEGKFDVVLTNMPYSQTTDYGSLYDIPSKNGDSICVQHCIKAIDKAADNGRIAMVVPEGFLFRKDLQKTRQYMLSNCNLQSVISLPQGVFLPYTGVKTNILYLTKIKKNNKQERVWFFDVKNDGYTLDNSRRKLEGGNDIERFLTNRKIDTEKQINNVDFDVIEIDKISQNDYILSGNRYKNQIEPLNLNYDSVSLGDCCEIINGTTPSKYKKEYWEDGEIDWFTIEDLREQGREINFTRQKVTPKAVKETSLRILPANTVLLCCTASVGEYAINNIPLTTNQQFNGLVINDKFKQKLLPKYLFYISSQFISQLKHMGSSTAFTYVSVGNLKKIKIPIPSLEVQMQIINELDNYSAIIRGNKLSIENYNPHIPSETDWDTVALGEICKFSGGTQPPKSTFVYEPKEGYIRLLQIRDYKSEDNVVYISKKDKHKTCTEEDIMIGRYGPPVFQILRGKAGAYNVALIKCIPDKKKLSNDWLYYFLNSEQIQKHIIGLSERSRQAGVSPSDLDKLKIPLPSIEIQKEVVKRIKEEEMLIASNKKLLEIFENKISVKINQVWGI